ncbi:MAG: hypothetical protein PHS14_12420 [Elusimicrobia bacterium]|nr:hypothetical protein [Elusimicrobiota bacterium]
MPAAKRVADYANMTTLISTFLILAAGLAHGAATNTSAVESFFPNTSIALPLGQGLKLEWAFQPLEESATAQAKAAAFSFDVDPQGNPWFGAGEKRFLASPLKNIALMTDVPFNNFAWHDGDRVLCTEDAVGGLASTGKAERVENGLPVLKFVPVVRQTRPGCRLFAGSNGALFVVTHEVKSKEEVVIRLLRVKGKLTAENLLTSEVKLSGIAGDADTWFFASGRGIYITTAALGKHTLYFKAPETVTGLAYSPEAGLFYTTQSFVGYVSPSFQLKFLSSPNPEIVLRDGKLYIRLNRTFGVLKLEGVNRFKSLRLAPK